MSVVLIDMDGVVADWSAGIERYVGGLGVPVDFFDWTRWEGHRADATPEQADLIRLAMSTPSFYRQLEPVPGALLALSEISAAHDVWLCSTPDATNVTCASDKIAWAEEHLGSGWGKRLILTHDKTLVNGDYLIDDKPEITGHMKPTWEHIYFERPYNADRVGRRRITHWNEWESILA